MANEHLHWYTHLLQQGLLEAVFVDLETMILSKIISTQKPANNSFMWKYNLIYKFTTFTTFVCLSDATVLRFNTPAELARTVGRTDTQILYGRTGPDRRPLYNFDQRSLVSLSVTVGIKVDIHGYHISLCFSNVSGTRRFFEVFSPTQTGGSFWFC